MPELLRIASPNDAQQMLEIYAPVVRETVISFELEPPSIVEMQQRIEKTLAKYPWLVIEDAGRVLGYAYATAHRDRLAYQWSADVSVYVHPLARRRGLARRLYTALLKLLRALGYYNAYAGIALPNEASIKLHEAMGFSQVAIYKQVGFKHGAWRDVGWWQLALRKRDNQPAPPQLFSDLPKQMEFED